MICIPFYLKEKEIVYIPENSTLKFHHDFLGIDSAGYYSYHLSNSQVKEVETDIIENKNWSKFDADEFDLFNHTFEDAKFSEFSEESSYICVYDDSHERVLESDEYKYTSNCTVFVYDALNKNYYCVYCSS